LATPSIKDASNSSSCSNFTWMLSTLLKGKIIEWFAFKSTLLLVFILSKNLYITSTLFLWFLLVIVEYPPKFWDHVQQKPTLGEEFQSNTEISAIFWHTISQIPEKQKWTWLVKWKWHKVTLSSCKSSTLAVNNSAANRNEDVLKCCGPQWRRKNRNIVREETLIAGKLLLKYDLMRLICYALIFQQLGFFPYVIDSLRNER
jgi:hypothetical protein